MALTNTTRWVSTILAPSRLIYLIQFSRVQLQICQLPLTRAITSQAIGPPGDKTLIETRENVTDDDMTKSGNTNYTTIKLTPILLLGNFLKTLIDAIFYFYNVF